MGDVAAVGILRPDPRPGVLWAPSRARRCLFGSPDHELAEKFLENETKKLEKRNRDRWNFDFIRETPLEGGRFAWTPVTKDAVAAEEGKDGDEDASSPSEKDGDDDGSSTCAAASSTDGKLSQKLITDFMRKRKLSSNQKEMTPEPRVKTRRRFST